MRTIADIADQWGAYLCKKTGQEAELKTVCYGLEAFLVFLVDIVTIFILGLLCGVFYQTALVMCSLLLMRSLVGGSHLSGFVRCLLFSSLMIMGVILSFKYYFIAQFSVLFAIVACLLSIYLIFRYAPVLVAWKDFSQQKVWRMRLNASGLMLLVTVVYLFWQNDWTKYLLIGNYLAVLNVTPLMQLAVTFVEKHTNMKDKEVK